MCKQATIKQQLARTINWELHKAHNHHKPFYRDYSLREFSSNLIEQYGLDRCTQVKNKLAEVIKLSDEIGVLKEKQVELLKEVSVSMIQWNEEEINHLLIINHEEPL